MPRVLVLLLLAAGAHAANVFVIADTANETLAIADSVNASIAEATEILNESNDTLTDGDHEPIVRKKRTFGDVVFRGLADVLGYNVARKPPQAFEFPPPVAQVPGIDAPLQAAAAPTPAPAPAPAPAAPPCGAPRAAAPPPCRARQPAPKPRAQPPCPKPRAAPKPKPTPRPPPPPPPCASPRANPTTAAPCAPPAPPKADSNLETITSNFRLNFNFNRAPATPVSAAADDIEEETAQEQDFVAPIAIQPQAAKLPPPAPRNPRVYVDAFVVRDGVPQRVHTIDAKNINRPQVADDDYLFYVDEEPQNDDQQDQLDDDYEDVQESRDRAKAVREFGSAVDQFWAQKQKPKRKLANNDYRKVHFGDRDLANQIRRRNDDTSQLSPEHLQRERPRANRIPTLVPEDDNSEEESEVTTTTQDPRRKLKPRVLPPTEHNPNQIDTVTVRVPPIYKEKNPKKLHREKPEAPDRDEDSAEDSSPRGGYRDYDSDADSEQSAQVERTEAPKRKRRRKKNRRTRSTRSQAYTAGDFDYYGKKLPISDEEEHYRTLTIPPPTKDADLARLEEADNYGDFLDDHERLREDPERIKEKKKKNPKEVAEESRSVEDRERADEEERADSSERTSEGGRADSGERSDALGPNARVRETGYKSNYVRATNVQVDDRQPKVSVLKRKNPIPSKP